MARNKQRRDAKGQYAGSDPAQLEATPEPVATGRAAAAFEAAKPLSAIQKAAALVAPRTFTLIDTWDEEVVITDGVLDEDAVWLFKSGHCHSFAFALHEATGLPLVGCVPITDDTMDPQEFEDTYWDPNMRYMNHLALLIDEDTALDAEGLHTLSELAGPDHMIRRFETSADAQTEMDRINDAWGGTEKMWQVARPDIAANFARTALGRWVPGLLDNVKRAQ